MHFDKPSLKISEQRDLLLQRGLVVNDVQELEHYLKYIGYYRLSGYMRPFQDIKHDFLGEVSFCEILNCYIFDRKLRVLTFDAIERIEISIRSLISNEMSEKGGGILV